MFINTNNWKEHFTASSSVSTRRGLWVALGSGGGPPRRILGVLLQSSLSVIVFYCSQVERGNLDVEGELDVGPDKPKVWSGWGCVGICWPAVGQARLCPTEAACGSVS